MHDVQVVRFAEIRKDPTLHVDAGGPTAKRDLNVLIGKNVRAGRIMAGVTFSEPGNWTSWPPHEHAAMLEEAYLYIDMPAPAFGVQLVYTDAREPELATIVREGDLVVMPQGYHPNVAAPGGAINFLWMMAANKENDDRQYRRRQRPSRLRGPGIGPRQGTEHAMNDPNVIAAFQHTSWASIPVEHLAEGIERQMIWGEHLMVCRLQFAPRVVTAVHSHPHEQITLVERGSVRFTVDGQERVASAGDVLHFPPHVQHGATMLDDQVVLIDIFHPLRQDFLPPAGSR